MLIGLLSNPLLLYYNFDNPRSIGASAGGPPGHGPKLPALPEDASLPFRISGGQTARSPAAFQMVRGGSGSLGLALSGYELLAL
jgi:hypothetical protein